MSKKYRQAVSALVLRPASVCSPDGCGTLYEVLLVHKPRRNDAWQLPQGGTEEGETPEDTARRELKEETGLTADELLHESTLEYTYDFPPPFVARHKPVNSGQTLKFVAFLALKDAKVTVDKREIDNHIWVLPEKIGAYIKRKEYLEIIHRILDDVMKILPPASDAPQ